MKESLRCVSLCDPEGVHAFILVLPVGPLTEEDKGESKMIQDTFSSQVSDFSMILFTVPCDPTAPAVVNFLKKNNSIQELLQSCGGRSFVFNIKDKQQIPELLDMVEKTRLYKDKPCSYTTETFAHVQMEKISRLHAKLEDLVTCDDEKQSSECLRIVLIGKTGCGKSSSGNTILGREEFKAESGQKSVSKHCQKGEGKVNGRPVTVVDTPGLFDVTLSHEEVHEEMMKCISLLAPGPHVFLLVVHIGRVTPEEKETLKLIKEGFGKEAEKFTIILLTGGDSLKKEKLSIEEYIKTECDDSFKKMISDYGGRYHVFNNREKQNRAQVSELMAKIDTMVKTNGGSCYTNEMLREAEPAIKSKMERLFKDKEEEMKREREELQRKRKEMVEIMKKQEEDMIKEREKREREFKEHKEIKHKEQEDKMKEKEKRDEEDRKRKQQEELRQQEWEHKLKDLERKIKLESEEKENIYRLLEESREKMREERESREKQQNEWWEKRNQEEEQRRQVERARFRKVQEEFEQEREKYGKKRKEKDQKRQEEEEEEERIKNQQRANMEKERKQKEKELKEMEENIKKEQEEKQKEKQMREEEDRTRKQQEEFQRLELKNKLTLLERKIKLESEEKETIVRQLEEAREKIREERESQEKQQNEWWEKRNEEEEQRRQEERTRFRKLQEEFEQEREIYEKKRKEDDLKRQEEEEERIKNQQRAEMEEGE
ncbi:golgin subfamily A member 6-like protein 22, partial [Notolabrus celidotus]|uniref:golgin subfamily A member 6-like protein 22 n=1 Tax=Notolabrus celidotus TaxID=1203425 RepID=UPI00148F4804